MGNQTFYFVTFTCFKWFPLLEKASIYDYLANWIRQINKRGVLNCGYVFMPNHLHLLVYVQETSKGLNHVVGEAKRFLAYEIVTRLEKQNETNLLKTLAQGVDESEKKKGKKHQVFRLSFDAKEVLGEEEICRVLDYIHHNPVSGKWSLAKDFLSYEHSSARFYEVGEEGKVEVFHYQEVTAFSESPADDSERE